MASYRPFPPPPQSNFAPPPLPNQPPRPPPPNSGQGNPYPQNWGYNGNDGSNYQHYNPASRNQRPPPLPNHQPQYAPPPPPPPDSSYPPPPPPSMQPPAPPMYYPSQQYSQFNHHHQQPPPPPPPPLNPPPNSVVPPPPPPPPSSPPPPPSSAPKDTKITPDKIKPREVKDEGASSKQRKPPPVPPVKKSNGPPGRAETEEERRIRKKREFEKQQHKQHLKDSQNKVLQKTQHLSSGIKAHGSVTGSQIGDKRNTHLLSGERIENRLKKPTTFLCKLKFRNELPDPTAQPKLLSLRRDKDRFTKYAITSLEKMHKPQLYVEPDLGIPLDLLDLSVYNPPKGKKLPLDPEDEELLRDDDAITPIKKDGIKRKERPEDIGMSWLVKTQYISPLSVESAKQSLTEKQAKELREARGGRTFVENSRKRQIQEIQASFEACKKLPVHATNRKLEPVEILPLIPDFDRYKEQFVIATFDGAPTADSTTYGKLANNVRDACESQAIMKSFTATGSDAKSGKFLGYMVPNPNELSKDMYDENEDISYSWVREYNWDVCRYVRGDDADDPTTYLVSFGENEAHYMPLPTKLVLRKKRSREGKSVEEVEYFPAPKRITARRRSTVSARELKEDGEYSGSKSSMGRSGMEHEKDMDLDQYSEGDDYESENE